MKKNRPTDFKKDLLKVRIYETADQLGQQAALFVTEKLQNIIHTKGKARIVIATGASQFAFYKELIQCNIEWPKITVFHLDEYLGIPESHPASFRKYLKERILDIVKPGNIHFLGGDAPDPEAEVQRYGRLLQEDEIDLACIGIGENGHIAFNDPAVANFNDNVPVKVVELDKDCRKQQLGEGWFKSLDDVPTHALSLTIPAIMNARTISCVVPDLRKSAAVRNTLEGPVAESCPASILRKHPDATLFLDPNSATLLTALE